MQYEGLCLDGPLKGRRRGEPRQTFMVRQQLEPVSPLAAKYAPDRIPPIKTILYEFVPLSQPTKVLALGFWISQNPGMRHYEYVLRLLEGRK